MTPFITSNSGAGEYFVKIKVGTLAELHAAHDIVLAAFARSSSSAGGSGVKGLADAITALEAAAEEFALIEMRLRDKQPERALGATMCGEKEVRAALSALSTSVERVEVTEAPPFPTKPIVFMTSADEGVLFDPQGRFHGWVMRQHPDGLWITVRKLDAKDPEDNPLLAALSPKSDNQVEG